MPNAPALSKRPPATSFTGEPYTSPARYAPPAPGPTVAKAATKTPLDLQLDAYTESVARPGNYARVLYDGAQSYAERERLIRGATETIHMQTFIFDDDATGWRIARALADRAKAGVTVRLIVDGVGSYSTGNKLYNFLAESGVQLRVIGLGESGLDRWHEKNLVVDGRAAIQGGMNIADEYAVSGGKVSRGWHDTDVLIQGPSVADAQADFLKNWTLLGGKTHPLEARRLFPVQPRYSSDTAVRVVQNHPGEDKNDIEDTYVLALDSAQAGESVDIESAYFVPTERVREALKAAAKRGARVRIITNNVEQSDMPPTAYAARNYYRELLRAGIEIYEMKRMMHTKAAVIGGQYTIVGSANLNHRSVKHDTETVVVIRSECVAARHRKQFEEVLKNSVRITEKTLDNDGWWMKLKCWFFGLMDYFF